jgi:hypothetical protein
MGIYAPRKLVDVTTRARNDKRCWQRSRAEAATAAPRASWSLAPNLPPPRVIFNVAIAEHRQSPAVRNGTDLVAWKEVARDGAYAIEEAALAWLRREEPPNAQRPFQPGLVDFVARLCGPVINSSDYDRHCLKIRDGTRPKGRDDLTWPDFPKRTPRHRLVCLFVEVERCGWLYLP